MKHITKAILGASFMTFAINPSDSSNISTPDEVAIHTVVESVANLADRGNFESLQQLYAEEVEVDYTSAFGGEVQLKSLQGLMNQWASTLPGFDRPLFLQETVRHL